MKKIFLTIIVAIFVFNFVQAESKVVREYNFDTLPANKVIIPQKTDNRQELFPDKKPIKDAIFAYATEGKDFKAALSKEGLILGYTNKEASENSSVKMIFNQIANTAIFEIRFKLNNFTAKSKGRVNIQTAGVNLMIRADRKDIRYYDVKIKKYIRATVLKSDVFYDLKLVINFNSNKPYYDLFIDGKKLVSKEQTRGTASKASSLAFLITPDGKILGPGITIKSIKISKD